MKRRVLGYGIMFPHPAIPTLPQQQTAVRRYVDKHDDLVWDQLDWAADIRDHRHKDFIERPGGQTIFTMAREGDHVVASTMWCFFTLARLRSALETLAGKNVTFAIADSRTPLVDTLHNPMFVPHFMEVMFLLQHHFGNVARTDPPPYGWKWWWKKKTGQRFIAPDEAERWKAKLIFDLKCQHKSWRKVSEEIKKGKFLKRSWEVRRWKLNMSQVYDLWAAHVLDYPQVAVEVISTYFRRAVANQSLDLDPEKYREMWKEILNDVDAQQYMATNVVGNGFFSTEEFDSSELPSMPAMADIDPEYRDEVEEQCRMESQQAEETFRINGR